MQTKGAWITILLYTIPLFIFSQHLKDSTANGVWKFTGYADAYLSLNQSLQNDQKISEFQFNHNRINRLQLNQGLLGLEYEAKDVRVNLAFHAGTYVKDNYAAEPALARSINKAFIGFRLNKKRNIWLDAGVFPSYIGFESVNAFENATLTRSLLAENSPYFLTGIRANYPVNPKNELSFYLLTGWQRIVPQKNNSTPSIGWQWAHTLPHQGKFNWSFWAGSDYPDSSRKWRYFNNFYWQGKKGSWSYTLGFDMGMEQKEMKSNDYNLWYSPVLITQFSASDKWRTAVRLERYADQHRIITRPANGSAVTANSQSFNIDYLPKPSLLCRIEWRALQAKEPVFYKRNAYNEKTHYLTASVAYQINAIVGKKQEKNRLP